MLRPHLADSPESYIDEADNIKVLLIIGSSRSGSTLLDLILGHFSGFFSLGEVYHIWERGFVKNELCGCGDPFKSCGFWSKVIQEAFGGFDCIDPVEILRLRSCLQRVRYAPLLGNPRLNTPRFRRSLERYLDIYRHLFKAIHKVSGSMVLIDSSKSPIYGLILNRVTGIDLHVIWLIRDSRAVAYSWQRWKRRPEIYWKEAYMPRLSALGASKEWLLFNSIGLMLSALSPHSITVRYEDLVTQPGETLQRIAKSFDIVLKESEIQSLLAHNAVVLKSNHTVSGNPIRYKRGEVEIKPDQEWQQAFPLMKRMIVTAVTWPLLLKYGYLGRK